MELYVKFVSTLAFGLIGLGAVLKVLLDTLFAEWDAFHDISQRVAALCQGKGGHVEHIRAEDILLEAEKKAAFSLGASGTRLAEQRRRQMKELDAVEARLNRGVIRPPVTDPGISPS